MNLFKKYLIALCLVVLSIGVRADVPDVWMYTQPQTSDQVTMYNYLFAKYNTGYNLAHINFYSPTEPLSWVMVNNGNVYGDFPYYFWSNQTRIGYSVIAANHTYSYKIMCPIGQSTILKKHIQYVKDFWKPNSYLPKSDGTACTSTPPANQTSIDTIKAMYSTAYTVTRLWPNQDIFSVRCTQSPACDVYTGYGYYANADDVVYYSNTQRIGYRGSSFDPGLQWVAIRTKDTVLDQTAKDDIDLLTWNGVEGQPWTWVDYSWNPVYTAWFD